MKSIITWSLHATWVAALALTSVGCSTVEPRAERYEAPPLDSSWVSARRDTGSYGASSVEVKGRRGEFTWEGKPHITFEGLEVDIVAQPSGPWIGLFRGGKPVITYDPPATYEWPLTVGQTYSKTYRVTNHATQQVSSMDTAYRIEAYEDVRVPAGTFKAFKVRTSDTLGNENVVWFSPELGIFVKQNLRRTDKHTQGVGTRDTELISQTIRK